MPRKEGIGRRRKRSGNPQAPRPKKVPAAIPESEESEELEEDLSWLRSVVYEVAEKSVDLQRQRNFRFMKYAATASACAADHKAACCTHDYLAQEVTEAAYDQAHLELESCVSDKPYGVLSRKYRCGSCGTSVCHCICRVDCKCGEHTAKWSWQRGRSDMWFCDCTDWRTQYDWAQFNWGAGVSPDLG